MTKYIVAGPDNKIQATWEGNTAHIPNPELADTPAEWNPLGPEITPADFSTGGTNAPDLDGGSDQAYRTGADQAETANAGREADQAHEAEAG